MAVLHTGCPSQSPGLSDIELYSQYVRHIGVSLSLTEDDLAVFQSCIPTLSQRSETVYYAILAISAAHIAWTMTSSNPPQHPDIVSEVILVGYQHYIQASEKMRKAMATARVDLDPLVASAFLLVPFASASQQINHWISSRTGNGLRKRLDSIPRDVVIIMRGVRALLQSLGINGHSKMVSIECDTRTALYAGLENPAPSQTHFMKGVIATTSRVAFAKLQQRLSSCLTFPEQVNQDLAACSAAFEILDYMRNCVFAPEPLQKTSLRSSQSTSPGVASLTLKAASMDHFSSSLRSSACISFALDDSSPPPSQTLTKFFLSFLIRVPQSYVDLVLPLLGQRLEKPTSSCASSILKQTHALALDIYAHWSILMFLAEVESWWIGTLPEVTLDGMINRYGEGHTWSSWAGNANANEKWWPAYMLRMLKDVKYFM